MNSNIVQVIKFKRTFLSSDNFVYCNQNRMTSSLARLRVLSKNNSCACNEAVRAEEKAATVVQSAEENTMSNWFEDACMRGRQKDDVIKDFNTI